MESSIVSTSCGLLKIDKTTLTNQHKLPFKRYMLYIYNFYSSEIVPRRTVLNDLNIHNICENTSQFDQFIALLSNKF